MADIYPFRCQYCDHRSRALQWAVHDVKRRREYERLWVEPPDGWPPPPGRRAPGSGHSINGWSLETDAPFGPGAVVGLKLDVAPSGPPAAVERAMVRSTHLGGAGLAFLRFGPAQRERLRALVLDLMTKRTLDPQRPLD